MKIAFVISENFLQIIQQTVNDLWPKVQPEYFLYEDYKETPELIRGRQKYYNGILFAGKAPYFYCKKYLETEIPWTYFEGDGSSLLKAVLIGVERGWKLSRFSVDSYDFNLVRRSFGELSMGKGFEHNMLYLGDVTNQRHNDQATDFHLCNYAKQKVDGCVTRLYTVWKNLKRENVPVVFGGPIHDSVYKQINVLQTLHQKENTKEKIYTVFMINIDFTAEYSLVFSNEYQGTMERLKLVGKIYQYADEISGAVIEISPKEYVIFSDRVCNAPDIAENVYFQLLNSLTDNSLYNVHIGIGCGETLSVAQKTARKALFGISHSENSVAYCMFPDGVGREIHPCGENTRHAEVDGVLFYIAEQSGINVQTAMKIRTFILERRRGLFTVKDLANYMKINIRSANRLVEKLEGAQFITVSGQISESGKGRPSRLLRFDLE